MPLIEAFTFMIVGAVAATVAIMMALVVIGIRNEERDVTMTRRKAPGMAAWLARRILGLYVRKPGPGRGNADWDEAGRLTGRRR
jgi:hypothetical protein